MLFTSEVLVWELWFCKNFNLKTAPAYWGLIIVSRICLCSNSFVNSQSGQIRTKLHMLPDLLLLQIHLSGIPYQYFLTSQLGSFLVFPLLRDCPIFLAFAQCCLYAYMYPINHNYVLHVCIIQVTYLPHIEWCFQFLLFAAFYVFQDKILSLLVLENVKLWRTKSGIYTWN